MLLSWPQPWAQGVDVYGCVLLPCLRTVHWRPDAHTPLQGSPVSKTPQQEAENPKGKRGGTGERGAWQRKPHSLRRWKEVYAVEDSVYVRLVSTLDGILRIWKFTKKPSKANVHVSYK